MDNNESDNYSDKIGESSEISLGKKKKKKKLGKRLGKDMGNKKLAGSNATVIFLCEIDIIFIAWLIKEIFSLMKQLNQRIFGKIADRNFIFIGNLVCLIITTKLYGKHTNAFTQIFI